MASLEVLVGDDHLVHLVAHVRLQDLGRDPRMVRDADGLPDVVTERRNHHLVIRAGSFGERRRLERVGELIDREAVGDVGQRAQHLEDALGNAVLVLERLLADHRPLVGGRLVHAREGGRHASSLAHRASGSVET